MSLCLMLLYLGGATPALSHTATLVEQAFIDGQATAQSAAPGASTNITNGTIATTVNSFNPSYYNFSSGAPEAGYFMGGSGDTITPGAGKVTACQTGPVNPNTFLQQNCEAINYMARNPTTRPQFTLAPGDPNAARTRSIEANPATLAANSLGYASPSAIGAFTGCTTQTITTPPTYTTEVCNEYLNATSQMCTVGRTIVVDADANYQCDKTTQAYETLKCQRSNNVSLEQHIQQNCVDGQRYNASGIRDQIVPVDMVLLTYVCNSAQATGPITIGSQAHGSRWGQCDQNYRDFQVDFTAITSASTPGAIAKYKSTSTPPWAWGTPTTTYDLTPPSSNPSELPTYWVNGPDMSPDWQSWCQPMRSMYRVTKACTALNPNCEIQMYWWQESCVTDSSDGWTVGGTTTCFTYRSDTLILDFLHPSQFVQSPVVTQADGCAALEARAR